MRFYEFSDDTGAVDRLILLFRNQIGRAASKKQSAVFNWDAISSMSRDIGFDVSNYDAFKSVHDTTPALQSLVKDFNKNQVELIVPGVSDTDDEQDMTGDMSSQEKVDQAAASAAPKQVAQAEQTPRI